jgi:hypothetical protein
MSTALQPANVPEELRRIPQWVCWRWSIKEGSGEKTKLPVNPNGTGLASTTNPATWSSFDKCYGLAKGGFADGVGFVFTREAGYVGVDLDNCLVDGALREPEATWVRALASYTEVSPSGTGGKVIFKGSLPDDLRRHSWGGNGIYDSGRFFTVTGDVFDGWDSVRHVGTAELQPLLDTWFPPQEAKGEGYNEAEETLTDNEVMVHLNREAGAQNTIRLYNGRWQEAGYDSQSEADLALVGKLAFYCGPCPTQIDRLFRASGLMRDKWDETRGGGLTYGEKTVEYALAGKTEFYTPHYTMQAYNVTPEGTREPVGEPMHIVDVVQAPVVTTKEGNMDPNQTVTFGNDFYGTKLPKHRWQQMLVGYPALKPQDRPDVLHSMVEYLAPLGQNLGEDWLDMMCLSFVSSLFPDARFENLPLNLWTLGISHQGVGKSVVGDELDRLAHGVAHHHGQGLLRFTSGTSAGLLRRMDGTGKSVLAYLSEWTGFAKSITQDYNSGMKESLLNMYDGRATHHQLATGDVNVVRPHLVVSGVTTKTAFISSADREDAGNGFYSRFMFVAPNPTRSATFRHRNDHERENLMAELSQHLTNMPEFSAITFDSRETPEALREYLGELGVADDGQEIDLDEVPAHGADEETPSGRLHARVKKVASLLELMEARPNVRRGILYVTETNVERAVRLVQRGNAYSVRVLAWLSRSKDEEYMGRVKKALNGSGLTLAGLMEATHLGRQQVEGALELLEGEGVALSNVVEGRRLYSKR